MSLDVIAEVWNTCKYAVDSEDLDDIAERVVGILVDHSYSLDKIAYHFSGDSSILSAVKYYSDEYSSSDSETFDDYEEDDDYDSDLDEYEKYNSDDY